MALTNAQRQRAYINRLKDKATMAEAAPQITVTIDGGFVEAIANLGAYREMSNQVGLALAEEADPEKLCLRLLRVIGWLADGDEPSADQCALLKSVRAQRRVAASADAMAQTQLKRHDGVGWRA